MSPKSNPIRYNNCQLLLYPSTPPPHTQTCRYLPSLAECMSWLLKGSRPVKSWGIMHNTCSRHCLLLGYATHKLLKQNMTQHYTWWSWTWFGPSVRHPQRHKLVGHRPVFCRYCPAAFWRQPNCQTPSASRCDRWPKRTDRVDESDQIHCYVQACKFTARRCHIHIYATMTINKLLLFLPLHYNLVNRRQTLTQRTTILVFRLLTHTLPVYFWDLMTGRIKTDNKEIRTQNHTPCL